MFFVNFEGLSWVNCLEKQIPSAICYAHVCVHNTSMDLKIKKLKPNQMSMEKIFSKKKSLFFVIEYTIFFLVYIKIHVYVYNLYFIFNTPRLINR